MTRHAELLAVRHGQSEWNLLGRWQGQADPALTALGERQAEIAAMSLPAFDLIASSDLQRARRTAEIIAKQVGVSDVVTDEALRERRAGPWEGLTRAQIERGWPGALAARRWPPGFEPEDSIAERLLPALRQHLCGGGRVLLVGHAGVLKTLDARVGLDDERVPNLAGRWFWLDGTAADLSWGWSQLVPGHRVELVSSDVDLRIE